MAVYRFSATIISRAGGRSATAAAAYRAAERIHDARSGLTHDYRRRGGVEYAEVMTPAGAPEWMGERTALWNGVEAAEKRRDAQLTREIQLALPHELEAWQRAELVRTFVRDQFVAKGMVADIAIHAPGREGDHRNHHAHVLLTMREIGRDGFGLKARQWNTTDQLETWRAQWAAYQNRALERAGRRERVDHRSYEAQGVEREAEPKLGPTAAKMEREGKASERGDERRAAQERNRLREALKKEAEVVDLALERERRTEEAQRRRQEDQYRQASGRREDVGTPRESREERQDRSADRQRHQEREKAYQRGRFESWANAKRAALQSRQIDERGDLANRQAAQRLDLDARLTAFYGPGREEAAKALEQARARLERGGLFYRLSGRFARDRDRADAAHRTLEDIERRENEQRGGLWWQHEGERERQDEGHRRQGKALELRIDTARQRREDGEWRDPWEEERDAAREARGRQGNDNVRSSGRGRGRSRSRDWGMEL